MSSNSETKLDAPGLKRRGPNRDRLYWIARDDIAKAGYMPRLIRLNYDINNPTDHRLIEAPCQRFDSEMKALDERPQAAEALRRHNPLA